MATEPDRPSSWSVVSEGLALLALGALLLIAALTMGDAILRWLGWTRIYGLHDLGEFVFAIVVASCFPIGLLRGSAITVRLFGVFFGSQARHKAEVFGALLTLVFFCLATASLAFLCLDVSAAGRTTSTLGWPLAPWAWATCIAFALATFAQAIRTMTLWRMSEGTP